ncbi:MAG: aminoacyl-tRNA hydrolase, partial [Bacilli bacterium]|nr:aminoacyl-tRNA hydrolase [Bacilli bacterium]
MKLIVGLGNPGKEYQSTRHNVGFMVLDSYLGEVKWSSKFNGLYYQTNINGEKYIFLKPQSYMNLSGGVIRKYVDYFKINIEDILVIQDDLDLSVGKIRIKINSSAGGHNGIK